MQTIPLYSASAHYQEWEMRIANALYTIVHDDAEWTLLQQQGAAWTDIGGMDAVTDFISQHGLMLAD